MKKKCLIVSSISSMIGQFIMPNIELLLSMGYDVTVIANFSFGNTFSKNDAKKLWDSLKNRNVEVHNIKFIRNVFSPKNIIAYKQVKKLVNENDYALIHCHSPIGGVITRLAIRKRYSVGTKVMYTAHGFHFYNGAPLINWLVYYPIEKWLSKMTDVLITINKEDYELAVRKMYARKIYLINGIGVDIDKFANSAIDMESKKNEINIPLDSIVLLSMGELNKNKNHQIIIKTISKIKNSDIYYVICGQGKQNRNLHLLSKRLKVDNRIVFLGYRDDVVDLLRISDIYVFPSLREGLSVSLIEAMAAGLPCVVSKIRGNIDLVVDEKGGFLCDANNSDEYKDKIETIVADNTLKQNMGKFNQNILKKFDLSVIMNEMRKIYVENIRDI